MTEAPTVTIPIRIKRHTIDQLRSEARRRRVRADEAGVGDPRERYFRGLVLSRARQMIKRFLSNTF
jgi:hypothetical protein